MPGQKSIYETFLVWTNKVKARGLAHHGGPPGKLEESDPAGMIFHAMDGLCRPPSVLYCLPCLVAAQL